MSNTLFKKVTATAAALSIVLSIVSPVVGVKAADTSVDAANRLASLGVIVDNSTDPSKYNLGSNITRREMLKVMMNLSSVEVTETCEGKFSDLPASDWGCKYAEAALKAGFIAANAKFRPNDMVTEAEALKMIMQARGVAKAEGVEPWSEAYRQAWVEAGIITADATVSATAAAKRSMVIVSADSAVTNTTGAEDDDSDVNLDDLFGGLFDEDGEDMSGSGETSTGTTSTGTDTSVKAGDLEVTLNPASPASATVPGAISLKIASFDFTAGSSDAEIKSITLKKEGLGSSKVFKDIILNGRDWRISSKGSFDSTTDLVELSLTNPLVVKAGSTETIHVVGTVGTVWNLATEISSGDKIGVSLTAVSTSGNLLGKLPVSSGIMTVWAVNAAQIEVDDDIDPSNVTLGEKSVDIARFKVTNKNTDNNATVSQVTLRDGENKLANLANIELYADGTKVADGVVSGKYLTFKFSPITIKSSNGVSYFKVKADVISGAADSIQLYLDRSTDVEWTDLKYGYGVAVNNLYAGKKITIQAGRLTVVRTNPTTTDIQQDKTDVLLGTFKIVNNGNNVRLEWLKVTATETAVNDVVRSDKLKLKFNWVTKTLDRVGATAVFSNADIDTVISKWETTFDVLVDTKSIVAAGKTIQLNIDFTADAVIKDVADDKSVTDITPSTISFSKLTVKSNTAKVTALPIATTNAVVGSNDIVVLKAAVEAGTMSDVKLSRVVVTGPAGKFTKARYSSISLYKDSVSSANLLKTVSPSDISGNDLAIDLGTTLNITKNSSVNLVVAVSLVDNSANADAVEWLFGLTAVTLYDADNKIVDLSASLPATSTKGIVIKAQGSLTMSEDTDSVYTADKNIVAGAESSVIGGWKFTAVNEWIKLKKIEVSSANLLSAVSKVTLLKSDKTTVIATKDVSSNTVTFDNEYIVNEWNETIYVKLTTLPYGKGQAWAVISANQLNLKVVEAEWASSNKDVVAWMVSDNVTLTGKFSVIPTRISTISFVKTATVGNTTASVDTTLSSGENTIAILQVTADKFSSTDSNGAELRAQLEKLNLSISNLKAATNVTIERLGGNGTSSVSKLSDDFAKADLATLGVNAQLKSQEVAYFVIKATPNTTGTNDSMQVVIDVLNTDFAYGSYTADNFAAAVETGFAPNLGTVKMTADKVVAK